MILINSTHLYLRQYVHIVNTKYAIMMIGRRAPGRPTKSPQDRPFQMRVSDEFLRVLDDWRRRQKDLPSRAEAIRRLVELGAKQKGASDRG